MSIHDDWPKQNADESPRKRNAGLWILIALVFVGVLVALGGHYYVKSNPWLLHIHIEYPQCTAEDAEEI
ncbi:MAG: hypothetical protein ACYTFO_04565, partial [Planctomycetota bacterium]